MAHARWLTVTVPFAPGEGADDADRLSGALFECGAHGFEVHDDRLAAIFYDDRAAEDLATYLSDVLDVAGLGARALAVAEIPEAEWWPHAAAHHAPIVHGPLAIVPSWAPEPEGRPEVQHVLRLAPSAAFGTGVHPTTAICLEALVAAPPRGRVLDVGTGTGILALAAAALGAADVVAVDIDPVAVEAARAHAAAHAFGDRIRVPDDLDGVEGVFGLVVANVRARPLEALAPDLVARLAPGGELLLCGLYADEVDRIRGVYGALGLEVARALEAGRWRGLTLRRAAR